MGHVTRYALLPTCMTVNRGQNQRVKPLKNNTGERLWSYSGKPYG